jgi:hypothetical protein
VANWIFLFSPRISITRFPNLLSKTETTLLLALLACCTYFLHPSRFLEFSVFNQVEWFSYR